MRQEGRRKEREAQEQREAEGGERCGGPSGWLLPGVPRSRSG